MHHVRYWHLADIAFGAPSSGFVSMSANDPKRTYGDHFHIVDNPSIIPGVSNGTNYLAAERASDLGKPVTITSVSGSSFTLNQLDIAELWLPGNANIIF